MSTGSKRTHAIAFADAESFRKLFPAAAFARWEFAGSLRRCRPDVGDIDHVVIPTIAEALVPQGLFGEAKKTSVNLLWQ